MLKLFALRDTTTNKLVPSLFFNSKKEAKQTRDNMPNTVVTYGPDHKKYTVK